MSECVAPLCFEGPAAVGMILLFLVAGFVFVGWICVGWQRHLHSQGIKWKDWI